MRFAFTEDQLLFQKAVRDLLAKECPPAAVREVWADARAATPIQVPPTLPFRWQKLAEMGVVGLLAPAGSGGLGLSEVDLVLTVEECGRAALPEPIIETAAVAVPLLVAAGDRRVDVVAAGNCPVAVALPDTGPYLAGATTARLLILPSGGELYAIDPADAEITPVDSVDPTRRLATVTWKPTAATRLDVPAGAAGQAFDRGALAAAAFLVGLADRMIELTADYARERQQFGQPIGSFQAVKHLLADALLRIDFARPAVYRAAWSLAQPAMAADVRGRDVSMAKAYASDAATRAARVALQVHGAIGYTWEHDLHLWMKRGWALAAAWGDAAWHRRRVGGWLLG
jgi:alkylation response protein AidB-like acyl-CoA dehydrogenase